MPLGGKSGGLQGSPHWFLSPERSQSGPPVVQFSSCRQRAEGQVWSSLSFMARSRSFTLQGEVQLENIACPLSESQPRTLGSFVREGEAGKVFGVGVRALSPRVSPEHDCSHVHNHLSHVSESEVIPGFQITLILANLVWSSLWWASWVGVSVTRCRFCRRRGQTVGRALLTR